MRYAVIIAQIPNTCCNTAIVDDGSQGHVPSLGDSGARHLYHRHHHPRHDAGDHLDRSTDVVDDELSKGLQVVTHDGRLRIVSYVKNVHEGMHSFQR